MPARTGKTTYVPGKGDVSPKRRKAKRKQVAGPYRSQSSVPSIRKQATKREHRTVAVRPPKPPEPPKDTRPERRKAVKRLARTLRDYPEVPPPLKLARTHPKVYETAFKRHLPYLAKEERLKEDPIAEVAIGAAATGGLGLAGKALGTAAERGGAAVLSKLAKGSEAKVAEAESKLAKAAKPTRIERIKSTPERVRTAPKRAKRAVKTPEGRRAVAKGAARKAKRHPVRTSYGAAAVSPVPLPAEADKRARAFVKGTAAALTHPKKVAETTAEAGLGLLTFPLSVGGAAYQSVKHGTPRYLKELAEKTAYIPASKTGTGRPSGLIGMAENLASGDPNRVEQTTLQETGLTPFIPVPHAVRRLKGTKTYEEARGKVRGKVEAKRAVKREQLLKEQQGKAAKGEFVSAKERKKVRHPVPVSTREGEHYVNRRLGKRIEKQRSRSYVAREVARMEQEGTLAGKGVSERVSRPIRKSKGTDQSAQNFGEALRIVVKHGLPMDETRGIALTKLLHDRWPKIKEGEVPPGHLDRHSTKFIIDHPEIFRDRHFWATVKQFDEQAKRVGTSPRNQFLAQVHNLINPLLKSEGRTPILTPEEMVTPGALKYLPKRKEPWNRTEALDYLEGLKQRRTELRRQDTRTNKAEAKRLLEEARFRTGESRAVRVRAANALFTGEKGNFELQATEASIKGLTRELEGLMRPPEHGGARKGVSTTRAVTWTPEMNKAFVRAARREIKHFGLREPAAYVADVLPSNLRGGESFPNYQGLHPLRAQWPSPGKAARSGNALSDYETLIFHSIEAPRARAAMVRGLNNIFDRSSRKIAGKRYLTYKEWESAANRGQIPPGVVPVRTQFLKSLFEGDDPVDEVTFRQQMFEEIEHGQQFASGELAGEMKLAKETGVPGEKFAPMDAVAMHELVGHLKGPPGITRGMGHVTNFATRAILNSPAFELSQFAQEGIPAAAALGRDVVHIPSAIRNLKKIAKLPPDDQARIRAVVGSSVGVLGAPKLQRLRAEGFMDPIRAAAPPKVWRRVWDVVNGNTLTRFDRARAGRFREVASMAKVHGDFKRAEKGFQLWRQGANNLFKDMERAVQDMKGMNAAERQLYISEHPKLADRLTRSMHSMMGNWDSYTVFEKQITPFAIFYPFQRYSVLWGLYHFPLDHPFVSTALAGLGALNAQELKRMAAKKGGTPDTFDYAKAVVPGGVLPGGQRFTALLGSVQEAVLSGKPSRALQGLSPGLGIPIEALTGKSLYTGEDIEESGLAYSLRQGANLSPWLRFLGVPEVGQKPSAASQAFHQLDPLRTQRSVLNPFIGQSEEQYSAERKLSKAFDEKYGSGRIPGPLDSKAVQGVLFGKNGKVDRKGLRKLITEIHAAESAGNFVKKKEEPFFPSDSQWTEEQTKALREIEDAWKTGPNVRKTARRTGIGGSTVGAIGGHPVRGSIGGGVGGAIGGHSVGGTIGG